LNNFGHLVDFQLALELIPKEIFSKCEKFIQVSTNQILHQQFLNQRKKLVAVSPPPNIARKNNNI
jgi:hypothetical protein